MIAVTKIWGRQITDLKAVGGDIKGRVQYLSGLTGGTAILLGGGSIGIWLKHWQMESGEPKSSG